MDRFPFLNVVVEVAGILNESRKLFLKNKKLMFSVLLFPLLLNCLVFLFNVFVIQPEITNMIRESSLLPMTDPNTREYSAHLKRFFAGFGLFIGSSSLFVAVSFIVNLFSAVVIVHASALTLKDENTMIKDVPVRTLKSWKGPLVTSFYIALLRLCYWFLFFLILCPLFWFSTKLNSLPSKSVASLAFLALSIIFAVFEFYLAIFWNLSMVISVLEETYGIQALGKAAKIAKGTKPKLFLLNLSLGLLSFGLAQILQLIINWRSSFSVTLTTGLVLVCFVFAVRMFQLVTYTVAYFQCKSFQGKDVESLRDVEYTRLSSSTLMG